MRRMLPSSPMLAIDAHDVTKTFKSGWLRPTRTAALRGVSLTVPRGTIVGLLGPNGAGKTTLLSILATLLTPDSGSVRVLGHDVVRDAARLRRRLNMASGRPQAPDPPGRRDRAEARPSRRALARRSAGRAPL